MKSILDPSFRYTPSASTDLRKTFARVRREMRKQQVGSQYLPADPGAARVLRFVRSDAVALLSFRRGPK